jgi:hypothetical protein
MSITCNQCEMEATKVSFRGQLFQLYPGKRLTFDLLRKASRDGSH